MKTEILSELLYWHYIQEDALEHLQSRNLINAEEIEKIKLLVSAKEFKEDEANILYKQMKESF